jgi:hypothetical protein
MSELSQQFEEAMAEIYRRAKSENLGVGNGTGGAVLMRQKTVGTLRFAHPTKRVS